MMDTIRELIIQELLARASVIKTPTYATDLGNTILRARPRLDPEDLPCIVIWPQVETAENIHGQSLHKMPLKVEGLALLESEDPSVISERILGDLIKCFTSPLWDRRRLIPGSSPVAYLNPYVEAIVYQGGGMDSPPEDGSVSAGAHAMFQVTYYTAIGDPFTQ